MHYLTLFSCPKFLCLDICQICADTVSRFVGEFLLQKVKVHPFIDLFDVSENESLTCMYI
jgi:hypothetical protein